MKNLLIICLALFSLSALQAQDLDKATVKNAVQSQEFIFKAETVFPLGGSTRQLTPGYDLRLNGDSLASYLPYFGRAFTAPMPGEEALKFESTDFNYKVKKKKKDSWEITIEPEDNADVRKMILRVFENGRSTLTVLSNNRQSISYSGYITVG